jgi:glycosyltransferase involved in cell wall biosynthesis
MITTRFGEIKNYDFRDEETALIAEEYKVDLFAEKMKFILKNPEKSREIGRKGRQMGLENFDYSKYGKVLLNYAKRSANSSRRFAG